MKTTNGAFTQTMSVRIDLDSILELIENILRELVTDYIASVAQNVDTDKIEFEWEAEDIIIANIQYTGHYHNVHYDATWDEPADDDTIFTPNESEFNEKHLIAYINQHCPDFMKNLITKLYIHINDDITFQEYEPD